MASTPYAAPDWGALLTAIDADLATSGAPTDIVSYSIGGRQVTKSRRDLIEYREWVAAQYNMEMAGGRITIADMSEGGYGVV